MFHEHQLALQRFDRVLCALRYDLGDLFKAMHSAFDLLQCRFFGRLLHSDQIFQLRRHILKGFYLRVDRLADIISGFISVGTHVANGLAEPLIGFLCRHHLFFAIRYSLRQVVHFGVSLSIGSFQRIAFLRQLIHLLRRFPKHRHSARIHSRRPCPVRLCLLHRRTEFILRLCQFVLF